MSRSVSFMRTTGITDLGMEEAEVSSSHLLQHQFDVGSA